MKHLFNNKKINKKRTITISLVSIMVIILFFSKSSFGKDYHSANVETNLKIAEPILVVENNPVIEINGKKQKEYYNFKVKNQNETGEITQVDLNYNIEILSKTQEKITYKLYKENQEIPLNNNKTENMKLGKGILQEDNYKLEIIYDKNKKSSVTDIIQDVQIKVHSEQAKI